MAWTYDVEATIGIYSGHERHAVQAAETGLRHAPQGTNARHRLLLQLARAHARSGHRDAAEDLLTVALADQEHLPAAARGLFAVDAARIHSYAATAHLALDDPARGRAHAERAVALYADAPPTLAPTRNAIALLDLAISHARTGSADDAASYGVRALAATRPAAAVATRGRDLDMLLAETSAGDPARRFHAELTAATSAR